MHVKQDVVKRPVRPREPTVWSPAPACQDGLVDVLSSRILLGPIDLHRSHQFYRDVLGLAVYREFGPQGAPGWCSSSAKACWKSPGNPMTPGTVR
jgi:hypothetical protein